MSLRIDLKDQRLGSAHRQLARPGENRDRIVSRCGFAPEGGSNECRSEAEQDKRYDHLQQRKPAGGC